MKNENQLTKVLFLDENEHPFPTLAVFPEIKVGRNKVQCYSHLGQHSSVTKSYYKALSQAKRHDYKPLEQELIRMGYNLLVMNEDHSEPIKAAITSEFSAELRTIIVYKDGAIKIIDQDSSDRRAVITFIQREEMQEIINALKAP